MLVKAVAARYRLSPKARRDLLITWALCWTTWARFSRRGQAMGSRLERSLLNFYRRRQRGQEPLAGQRGQESLAGLKAAAFRAAAEERLKGLEREVAEVKSRVNGLIFVVLGAVLAQMFLSLMQ